MHSDQAFTDAARGSATEVFRAFLWLGLTSFGGPIAHLGYFRNEFVERRRWLDDNGYSELVALCQFLPGPASSQVGIALGLSRAGWPGGLAAWVGFTMPSALALIALGYGAAYLDEATQAGAVRGLKIVAVAVVAQAVWSMARTLCTDGLRVGLAMAAALVVLAWPGTFGQLGAMAAAGLVGWWRIAPVAPAPAPRRGFGVSRFAGVVAATTFAGLLVGLPILAGLVASPTLALVDRFYRAGALVFGGGHVVLPLLHASVVDAGMASDAVFLAGYGATQAMPGPLFTFSAYLGTVIGTEPGGWQGGLLCLAAIFLPAWLLVIAALPFWDRWRTRRAMQAAMAGTNAAVVGLLLAALYDPVWIAGIRSRADFGLALASFALLAGRRVPPPVVVALAAVGGWLLAPGGWN